MLSIPMGAVSDRIGRKGPMIVRARAAGDLHAGIRLRASRCDAVRRAAAAGGRRRHDLDRRLRADRRSLRPGRARARDGAGDGGQHLGIIIGPVLGGWLYEIGGIRLPFLVVAALAVIDLIVFALVAPHTHGSGTSAPDARAC